MIEEQTYEKLNEMIHKGTTTIGIVCQDGVVFSSDTRVTMGYFVAHKYGKKIYPLDKHLAITIAGVVADAQKVVDILKANARLFLLDKERPMSVRACARLAANILFQSRVSPLILQALIGGIDVSGAHIFSIDPFGSVTEETYVSTGSGSPIAYGVLEDQYHEDMNVDDGVKLVIRAISSAMKRDIASGDSFDVVLVGKDGYQELTEEEKKSFELKK